MNTIKKIRMVLALSVSMLSIAVQAQDSTRVKVSAQFSSTIDDVKDLLMLENIDYQKIRFEAPELMGKNFALRALEIWDGEVRDSALLHSSIQRGKAITDSAFEVRVISKINEDKQIRIHFHMPNAVVRKTFKTIPEQAALYSLRNVVRDSKKDVEIGKTFYMMAYILPVADPNRPGWLSYCNVDDSGEDVREWGKKLGIPHYIVFEMVFH